MDFPEHLLHFIWQFRLFNTTRLFSTDGEVLRVLQPGILNKNAGPDFGEARVVIGDTTWAGQVELHLRSSDWMLHGHHKDPAYNSVILHVVYKYDKPVYRSNGTIVPVLVLENLFSAHLLINYKALVASVNKFPCQKHIAAIEEIIVSGFLTRLIVERLEQKSGEVFSKIEKNSGNWEQTFFYFLARNFGFSVNATPFGLLADSMPFSVFSRHYDNLQQITALVFGQAGFLTGDFFEEYPSQLQHEYFYLRKKYTLEPIDNSLWKFLRMRPQNFPTIRLAQFAALLAKSGRLFSKVLKASTAEDLYTLFNDLPVDKYWNTHYHFNKTTRRVIVQPGLAFVHNVIINTVCLFLFSYGRYTDQPLLAERAFRFLEEIRAESNSIVQLYVDAGVKVRDAFTSQALLQLNKYYCTQKKCLNCGIGIKILKK